MSQAQITEEFLLDYLLDMGDCGRLFSSHHLEHHHDFECRRATLALELIEPMRRRGFRPETDLGEFIQVCHGGRFYGSGMYLEIPEDLSVFLESTTEPLRRIVLRNHQSEVMPHALKALRQALRYYYREFEGVDLSPANLKRLGLMPDPEIDYDNF